MLGYGIFKTVMLEKFILEYPTAEIVDDEMLIVKENTEASISLKHAYEEYKIVGDIEMICEKYKETLREEFAKCKFIIDYDKVYPLVKNKDFGKTENIEFVREGLFLDLDVLYVMDMGETFRYIMEGDKHDFNILKKSACKNLGSITTGLQKIDRDFDIYSLPFCTDYSSSFLIRNLSS